MLNKSSMRVVCLQALYFTYTAGIMAYLASTLVSPVDKEFGMRNMGTIITSLGALFVAFTIVSGLMAARHVRMNWVILGAITFFLTLVVSVQVVNFSILDLIDEDGTAGAARLFSGLFNMNLGLLPEAITEVMETIFVAFLATAIAVPIAFLLAFFCAKNIMKSPLSFSIYAALRTVLNVTRSIEPLIWAVIFSVWVGIGPFAGMLALMIHSIASLTKQYSEIIESVEDGPIEGVRATGANETQIIWFGIVPQIVLPYIAFTFYRWDINVRMATVIGLVGGGGIGTLLMKYQGQAMWPEVGCIILVIATVVWTMDTASAFVREALK